MILKYGSYAFDDAEVGIHIQRRGIYSPRGRRMWTRHTWIVEGVKIVDSTGLTAAQVQANLTAALTTLEVACLTDGQDLLFYDNAGAPTSHGLFNSACVNGVQVKGPVHYPGGNQGFWGMGTEYVDKRTYRVIFEGDVYNPTDPLISWSETITKIGSGGPLNIWQESFLGVPQWQQPKLVTKCRMIQQGSGLGMNTWPTVSSPLFGNPYIRNDLSMYEKGLPRNQGINFQTHYPIRWRYVFEGPPGVF